LDKRFSPEFVQSLACTLESTLVKVGRRRKRITKKHLFVAFF
jgi:hypothetical protein